MNTMTGCTRITIAALAALTFGAVPGAAQHQAVPSPVPEVAFASVRPPVQVPAPGLAALGDLAALDLPALSARQDPADSLWRAARRHLNDRDWRRAARDYETLRRQYPNSTYVGDSFYWQAQALFRGGSAEGLRQAIDLLQLQMRQHPDAPTAEDAQALMVRIQSQQAGRGNAQAARAVARSASEAGDCEENDTRLMALQALLRMDPDRAMPILREVLQDRDECEAELREQAVFLIAQSSSPETVELLVDLAWRDPDPSEDVREAAVFWLSQVQSEAALDALLSILESGEGTASIREAAVYAVSQHRSDRVAGVLRELAVDRSADPELRQQAIFWIGQRPGGTGWLRDLWDSADTEDLKEQLLHAVAQSQGPENLDWLLARALDATESTEIRKTALFWAGQSGGELEPILRIYRTADDVELREQAIFVISQRQGPTAVDALMEIARTEEDRELRENAIFWLGQSRDPRVAEFLLEIVRGGGGGR